MCHRCSFWLGVALVVAASACLSWKHGQSSAQTTSAAATPDPLRFDLSTIDRSADACRDFYAYACGGWMATHPIPPDKPRVSRYDEMIDRNEAWTRELLERAADPVHSRSRMEQQVGDDYASCLEQAAIDARGVSPLREEMEAIDTAVGAQNWAAIFARLHLQNVNAPFSLYLDQDIRSPDEMMLQIDVGGMGLRWAAYLCGSRIESPLTFNDADRQYPECSEIHFAVRPSRL